MSVLLPIARFAALLALPPEDPQTSQTVVVLGRRTADQPDTAATTASTDAAAIARTINTLNVEDTLKYLPSLILRKRHIGDTQAPIATRTSGLGASARSLIYADGALLSALIGNNNTTASPRWGVVSTEEIARIDVLYGPFSAAYPGNSIGAVVNITTRLPDALEATLTAGSNVQQFAQYGTRATLPSYQIAGTIGDRFGPLALFASVDHVDSRAQPLNYVTALRPAATSTAGTPVVGGFDDLNRSGAAIRVIGANGIEAQRQDRVKVKAALDIARDLRLTYIGALFRNDTEASAESYLTSPATGLPIFAGALNIAGRTYTIAPGAFSGGVYALDQRHWSHSLSADGGVDRLDWQVIATRYVVDRDVQRSPTVALPAVGGAGTITRLEGTGWWTLDARVSWRSDAAATHTLSAGGHGDWFRIASDRFATNDWQRGSAGALNLRSAGRTRTLGVWAEDAWCLTPDATLTLGGRQEWWRAYDAVNLSLTPAIDVVQPRRSASRFSPKATLAWQPQADWTLRASYGEAWRFPTVGELYQVVTNPVPAVPNPDLAPERARSLEVAAEHSDEAGLLRLALFSEVVDDALISQSGPLNGTTTLATFVQNVERTQARGAELAVQRRDLLPRVDVSGSVTYARAETVRNPVFPASIGKLLPGVPEWKATLVTTWRPSDAASLTAAARYASRIFGTIDNSDIVGNTFQGFEGYVVVDLRAQLRVADRLELGLGADNVFNRRYFLFHPFPHRSFTADLTLRL